MPDDRESDTSRVFAAVARRVLHLHPDDEPGRMLQSAGLRTGGRFYAFPTAVDVVVKLPASRVSDLIDSGRGAPCSPRPGRPMKEWVRIATPDERDCLSYVLEARAFVTAVSGQRLKKATSA